MLRVGSAFRNFEDIHSITLSFAVHYEILFTPFPKIGTTITNGKIRPQILSITDIFKQ